MLQRRDERNIWHYTLLSAFQRLLGFGDAAAYLFADAQFPLGKEYPSSLRGYIEETVAHYLKNCTVVRLGSVWEGKAIVAP